MFVLCAVQHVQIAANTPTMDIPRFRYDTLFRCVVCVYRCLLRPRHKHCIGRGHIKPTHLRFVGRSSALKARPHPDTRWTAVVHSQQLGGTSYTGITYLVPGIYFRLLLFSVPTFQYSSSTRLGCCCCSCGCLLVVRRDSLLDNRLSS